MKNRSTRGDSHAGDQVGGATDCAPSPGVLCEGDKPPLLLKEPLGQTEGLERPRLHLQRVHGCWLAKKTGCREFCTGGCPLAKLLNLSGANT